MMLPKKCLSRAALTLIALLTATISVFAQQGKGGGGGGGNPPPPGTVYFYLNGDVRGMTASGSGKFLALPGSSGIPEMEDLAPSSRLYGTGTRWWLGVGIIPGQINPTNNLPQTELFAYRLNAAAPGGVQRVQITNLFPSFWNDGFPSQWSNDGEDSF